MRRYQLNQQVWFPRVKKKAVIKEFLPNGLVRITYFHPETDERKIADVLREDLREFKVSTDNKYYNMVKEFHLAFNLPVSDKPTRLTQEEKDSRIKWMQEELDEYRDANTLEDEVDGLIDLLYFDIGTLVQHGVKPDRIFEIVQKANMSKLWEDGKPRYREEDGKVIKPPTWVNPEDLIRKEIERQSR